MIVIINHYIQLFSCGHLKHPNNLQNFLHLKTTPFIFFHKLCETLIKWCLCHFEMTELTGEI